MVFLVTRHEDHLSQAKTDHPQLFAGRAPLTLTWGVTDQGQSAAVLGRLTRDKTFPADKRPFVVDLDQSRGSLLVSIDSPPRAIFDGASQSSTVAMGPDHPLKAVLGLRSEMLAPDFDPLTYTSVDGPWDVRQAFECLLKEQSGFPQVAISNSGAEAIEVALLACQKRHPKRRRILAFDGSFHGRTLLALHCTHNPSKRVPFDFYKERVSFLPFPDAPTCRRGEFSDPSLSEKEDSALLALRRECEKELPLCVLIEPMQSEGGDRYASPRFFQALRRLTRELDIPLVFDEVQTGFGLGGPFFWFQRFDLPAPPDYVCLAKKAQAAATLSHEPIPVSTTTAAASLYRGYLQALTVLRSDWRHTETRIWSRLSALEAVAPPRFFRNPRGVAYAFSFDCESPEALAELLKKRETVGLHFLQAGAQTARFRIACDVTDSELDLLFEKLRELLGLSPVTPLITLPAIPPPIDPAWIPKTFEQFVSLTPSHWDKIFRAIVRHYPLILRSPLNLQYPLHHLFALSAQDLWKAYDIGELSLLDFLWQSSRRFGLQLMRLDAAGIERLRGPIWDLEVAAYEPARRDTPETFLSLAQDPKTIFIAALAPTGELAGISCAVPPHYFETKIKLVERDPARREPDALYSMDISIHPKFQGQGLGLRMKCEQILACHTQGATVLRSRNRVPEAQAMVNLNVSLGGVVIDVDHEAYGGSGTALYQTVPIRGVHPELPATQDSHFVGPLRHKLVHWWVMSEAFEAAISKLKPHLPEDYRHFYVTSGRAEMADKAVKVLRSQRPQATRAISFRGDFFGQTTAVARSLGGTGPVYFDDWICESPDAEGLKRLDTQVSTLGASRCLGVFVSPHRKDPTFLKALLAWAKTSGIPVIFEETDSAFYQAHRRHFCLAGSDSRQGLSPDGLLFAPGGQLGILAVTESLFYDKPLTMVSTWDGDEHSLNLMCMRLDACST